jgi:hypothetical protein
MSEQWTDRARQVLRFAEEAAQRFNDGRIGSEHVLLGLLQEGSGVAVLALKNRGLDPDVVRTFVENLVLGKAVFGFAGRTRQARIDLVLAYALEEASYAKAGRVGTDHLLLGLLRDREGTAARALRHLGLNLDGYGPRDFLAAAGQPRFQRADPPLVLAPLYPKPAPPVAPPPPPPTVDPAPPVPPTAPAQEPFNPTWIIVATLMGALIGGLTGNTWDADYGPLIGFLLGGVAAGFLVAWLLTPER